MKPMNNIKNIKDYENNNCSRTSFGALRNEKIKSDDCALTNLQSPNSSKVAKLLMPQGFPTSYAQLGVSVFFLGSFIGESIINPVTQVIGKKPVGFALTIFFIGAAYAISHLSTSTLQGVVRLLQIMAALAGVVSLLYSLSGNSSMVPFHELLTSNHGVKSLLIIMLLGMVLGTHSNKIKDIFNSYAGKLMSQGIVLTKGLPNSFATLVTENNVQSIQSQTGSKLDTVRKGSIEVVSSDEYLFSSICE